MRTITLALLVSALGCVPWPHSYTKAPAMVGIVERAEVPEAGVRVRYSLDLAAEGCTGPGPETITDSDGTFLLPGQQGRRFFRGALPPERPFRWRMCLGAPEGGTVVWEDFVTSATVPRTLHLLCDLGAAEAEACRIFHIGW